MSKRTSPAGHRGSSADRRKAFRLDQIDAELLRVLQESNRLTSDALGALVGLSATACQRRLSRLRDLGVIRADVSLVSPSAVGRPLQMLILVKLERERSDIIDEFKQTISSTAEIMQGMYITGEYDFALTVTARDMDDYETFTHNFFYQNPNIKAFKTFVVMDFVKAGMTVPIELT